MVADIPDRKQKLQALNLFILLLPPIHRYCLKVCVLILPSCVHGAPIRSEVVVKFAYRIVSPQDIAMPSKPIFSPTSLDSWSLRKHVLILKRFLSTARLFLHVQHL